MRRDRQTTKAFYKHSETGEIFVIEKRWDGVLLGSCGPLPEDNLKEPADYKCTNKNNLWIQDMSDRLTMI